MKHFFKYTGDEQYVVFCNDGDVIPMKWLCTVRAFLRDNKDVCPVAWDREGREIIN